MKVIRTYDCHATRSYGVYEQTSDEDYTLLDTFFTIEEARELSGDDAPIADLLSCGRDWHIVSKR